MKPFKFTGTGPRYALVAALALGQGAISCALAQTAQAPAKSPATPASPPVQPQGMMVSIDPETKQLRPVTAEEAAALANPRKPKLAGVPASAPLVPLLYPGGRLSVRLPESFLETATVTKNADGKLAYGCVHGTDVTLEAAGSPAAARPAAGPAAPTALPTSNVRLEEK